MNIGAKLLATVVVTLVSTGARAEVLIDSFEGRSTVAPWTFSNGAEFPGATGSLTLNGGRSGSGAHLAYDFSQGGNYVAMSLQLPAPITTPAISFWVRSPPGIAIAVRAFDVTGQMLMYRLTRPASTRSDTSVWYQHVVALGPPTIRAGGANDGVVHYPIRSVSLLAENTLVESGRVGAVDFDDIVGLASTDLTLNPAQPFIQREGGGGDMLAGLGVMHHFARDDDRALDAAKSAGFTWVRIDLFWGEVERAANVYDFTRYDALLAALQQRGLKPLFILGYGNALYTGGFLPAPTTPAAVKAYGNFAEAAARRFAGKDVRYEVWNEANLVPYWTPLPDPNLYAPLAIEALRRIRQGDPKAVVSTTGLSGFDLKFAEGFLSKGAGTGYDAIAVHPYDVTSPPGILADKMFSFRTLIRSHLPSAMPVWNTEWGISSEGFPTFGNGHDAAARRRQATLVVRALLSAHAMNCELNIYYNMRDAGVDASDRESNYGLLENDYTEKPAMIAVKTLTSFVRARFFAGFVDMKRSGMTAMRFDGPSDTVVALWLDSANSEATVTVLGPVSAADVLGAPVTLQNGTLPLREVDGPVYLKFPYSLQNGLPSRLANLSVRTALAENQNLTVGFVTSASKRILVRAVGPTLRTVAAVSDYMADPRLVLASNGQTAAQNDNWDASLSSNFAELGAFALDGGSKDAALVHSVNGPHTAEISGVGSGIVLVEVYDAEARSSARLTNVSARSKVGVGDNVLIAGLVIGGVAPHTLLIRGVGPAMRDLFGVQGVLVDPKIEIFDQAGRLLAENDNWDASLTGTFANVGAFALPSGSKDAAVLVTLMPGAYSAKVLGVGNTQGDAIAEIYEVR
jgi:hypothetical protein